jgi:hypothetical protein
MSESGIQDTTRAFAGGQIPHRYFGTGIFHALQNTDMTFCSMLTPLGSCGSPLALVPYISHSIPFLAQLPFEQLRIVGVVDVVGLTRRRMSQYYSR